MDQVHLAASPRDTFGSRVSRRLRREGRVPAIVYGSDHASVPVSVDARELYTVLHTDAGTNAVISLDVGGTETVTAVAREIQRHPVRGEITHLDFIQVRLDVAIEAEVALEFIGVPIGVREDGGIVETISQTVTIEALPTEIPASIELDISDVALGDSLKLADLPTIPGVEYLDDLDRPIMAVYMPRVEVEPEVEELLEGEEAAAADEEAAAEDEAAEESDEG